jgi:signal transduction histidine kinase
MRVRAHLSRRSARGPPRATAHPTPHDDARSSSPRRRAGGGGLRRRRDRVTIRVTDSGIGIPAGELDRIFEPFVQVNASLTRTQEGTGSASRISRDLARGMGGDLTAESTPGAGSTFTLTLPRG